MPFYETISCHGKGEAESAVWLDPRTGPRRCTERFPSSCYQRGALRGPTSLAVEWSPPPTATGTRRPFVRRRLRSLSKHIRLHYSGHPPLVTRSGSRMSGWGQSSPTQRGTGPPSPPKTRPNSSSGAGGKPKLMELVTLKYDYPAVALNEQNVLGLGFESWLARAQQTQLVTQALSLALSHSRTTNRRCMRCKTRCHYK